MTIIEYHFLLAITAFVIIMLLAMVFLLWRRNHRMAGKVTFLLNAIDNGDYAFRYPEEKNGDAMVNNALNRNKAILQHARDEQIAK